MNLLIIYNHEMASRILILFILIGCNNAHAATINLTGSDPDSVFEILNQTITANFGEDIFISHVNDILIEDSIISTSGGGSIYIESDTGIFILSGMLIAEGGTINIIAGDSIELGPDLFASVTFETSPIPDLDRIEAINGSIIISDPAIIINPVPLPAGILFFATGLFLLSQFKKKLRIAI